ncbi:MAG: class I SAM-dependent methyltransferase [Actinomycetota bacterium]|nr:class I SAM-dependent methyltransferase [Actinomycetota bacterium]
MIQPNSTVLEIGCGSWSPIREHCLSVGASWSGVDVAGSLATRIESVENLSFADETFDFVVGNQTLEHWNEFGCRMDVGLWQCFRVCKPGGLVLMNVPIRFHGSRIFVEGDLDSIRDLFAPYATDVELIPWRRNSEPLPPVDLLTGYRRLAASASYQLDIRATRAGQLPRRPRSYVLRSRMARELLDHPLPFLVWKLRSKIANRGHDRVVGEG